MIDAASTSRLLSSGLRRPQIVRLAVLGVLAYGAAVAVVRLFDHLANRDELAQLRQQGGPMYEVSCVTCVGSGTTVAAWATDERAVLLWVLMALATTVGIAVSRRTSSRTLPH